MKIAVAGGTGVVGKLVVEAARDAGHQTSVISRANGIDLMSGTGLPEALAGVETVIDVTNSASISRSRATAFFETATTKLLAAEADAGVRHHVALSIVGIDRVPTGYYAAKLRQEELIAAGGIPWTVLRATQFHEFAGQLLAQTKGPIAPVPRMRSATVAAREVAEHLVELAEAPPRGRAPELAGPQVHQMTDLARELLRAQGSHRLVVPIRVPGGQAMLNGGLLPTGEALRGRQTFAEFLRDFAGAR